MNANEDSLSRLASELGESLARRHHRLAVAESCTGGWIAKVITDVPGSSAWFERGFVTYSNAAKVDMLGVSETCLAEHGAVSEATVTAMVNGALERSNAHWALAVTGVAGPDGGSEDKPVGLVWIAWQRRGGEARVRAIHFDGDREAVRRQSVQAALWGLQGLSNE